MSEDLCMKLEEDFTKRLELVDEKIADLIIRISVLESWISRVSGDEQPFDIEDNEDG